MKKGVKVIREQLYYNSSDNFMASSGNKDTVKYYLL